MNKKHNDLLSNPPNLNMYWGALVVEELVRNGVDHFFVSPGSRSTPITWAVAAHPRANRIVHYDERGAAYCALGAAKGLGRPTAVVSTSGTAAANFFPAVVEAAMSQVPLILLTADRPPEAVESGANQTVDQVHMFGNYTRWFFNLACPDPQIPGRTALTAIDQAVYRALGSPAGPAHINLMFREPLAPVETGHSLLEMTVPLENWQNSGEPYTLYDRPGRQPTSDALARVAGIARNAKRGLLIAAQLASSAETASVLELARRLNWPVFPEITSGLRLGPEEAPFAHYYDQMLVSESFREFCRPDAVIQIGSPYVSKRLQRQMQAFSPRHYVVVANHPHRHDPSHIATMRIESTVESFCAGLVEELCGEPLEPARGWFDEILRRNKACREALGKSIPVPGRLTEPAAARMLPSLMPPESALILASSMPIRDVDMYAAPAGKIIFATANRGASGVDGIVATAAGYAHGSGKPVVLLIGDQAMLYDMNSLALLRRVKPPVVIVVVNNFGGGIFSFLPIAGFGEFFEEFWGTPHSYTFERAAEMFDIDYASPSTTGEFADAMKAAIRSGKHALVEVQSNREQNAQTHRDIQEHVRKTLDAIV